MRPVPAAGLHVAEIDGELVLLHEGGERVVYCNPSAALVFRLCDGQRSDAEIVALLAEAYPESAQELPGDVARALQQLADGGCVRLE